MSPNAANDLLSTTVVLIVDDDANVRRVISRLLEACGCEVVAAETGSEGIALFIEQPERFQLLLIDQGLPDMKGDDLLVGIRQVDPEKKALLMSGAYPSEGTDSVWDGFLLKPFGIDELRATVTNVLESQAA